MTLWTGLKQQYSASDDIKSSQTKKKKNKGGRVSSLLTRLRETGGVRRNILATETLFALTRNM